MGLSRGVTVHVGTSFGTARETSSAASGSTRRPTKSSSKTIQLKLNRSRKQLAQEKEQQKRRIESKFFFLFLQSLTY